MQLSEASLRALRELAKGPCETWRRPGSGSRLVSGVSATALIRRGLADWNLNSQGLKVVWITERGRQELERTAPSANAKQTPSKR